MRDGVENMLAQAGKYACYYLCLCHAARRDFRVDDVEWVQDAGWLGRDFTVNNPTAIMTYFTGDRWTIHKMPIAEYIPSRGDVAIYCWYNPRTKLNHFNFRKSREYEGFDPLGSDSITVKEGSVRSVRVLRKVK